MQPKLVTATDHTTVKTGHRVGWLVPLFVGGAALQLFALWEGLHTAVAERLQLGDGLGIAAAVVAQLWAAAAVLIVVWRLVLVSRYRPVESVSDAELPPITVIVPAYNEGRQVYDTLCSLVASDYPAEKLQIVAVDDGSKDDTWDWIERARARFGRRITSVRFRANRGKREGLYEGFRRATGEVLVTVDSDSEVLADTLRNLVSPFVRDRRVGAVAGNVRVLNDQSALGKMLDVTFTFSFEFMRASESMVNTVFCTPGALSAYRRDIVETVKDQWRNQTFLGQKANIGEDRAMTNLILRSGHLVRFQSNAIVLTEVPERVGQLSRMLLRWARSNVRETIALARFAFTRFRPESALGARINLIWAATSTLVGAVLFLPSVFVLLTRPAAIGYVAIGLSISALLPASVYALIRGVERAVWALPWALFNAACLSWIGPWALLTPHRSAWLTRSLPAPAKPVPAVAEADGPRELAA